MLKQIAWNTFKTTGNINTMLELLEVDKTFDNIKNAKDNKNVQNINNINALNNNSNYLYRTGKRNLGTSSLISTLLIPANISI